MKIFVRDWHCRTGNSPETLFNVARQGRDGSDNGPKPVGRS